MMLFVYVILLTFPLLAFFLFKKYTNNPSSPIPGPKGIPILGNLHQLDSSNLHSQLWELSKIYGPLFSLKIGPKQAVVVSTPKLAKEVLKDHDIDVSNRPPTLVQQKLSYNGLDMIFSPYNHYWREMRKISVVHFFSAKMISGFSHIRTSEVKQMIKKISGHVSSSKVTNLSEIVMSVSSAIICRTAFGKRYEDESVERSRFHGLLNDSQAMALKFFLSDHIPLLGWVDRLTGSIGRLEKIFNELDDFFQEVIEEHIDPNRQKVAEHDDIVDVLLDLKKQGQLSIDLTNNHIKAIIMNLLVAGIDTSAATSIWVMTGLMKNPRVMKKAQEEVRNLYSQKDFIDEEEIQKLVYLKAVIKETFRLFAPAPLVVRETAKGFNINGHQIPPKTSIFVNVWGIQRDSEAWKNPDEFYPERFLNTDIDFRGQDFELIPFGAGRRICPGLPMGVATVELIVANLLNSFDWELPAGMTSEDIDTEGFPGIARHKKNHLCLIASNHI